MKKIIILLLSIVLISGCGKDNDKINSGSDLATAKDVMINDLDNYSYDATITTKTGIMDVVVTMNCKEDRKNQIGYCQTSTYGVDTEEYIDYKNKIAYSKVTTLFGGDSSNGEWTSVTYSGGNTNAWLDLNDYIFDLTKETKDEGTYYTGIIDSKKLATAISQVDSDTDVSNIVSDDIDISVFVNSSNYIEKMSFTIEIMGFEEVIEINYKGFNQSGDIVIPAEAMKN